MAGIIYRLFRLRSLFSTEAVDGDKSLCLLCFFIGRFHGTKVAVFADSTSNSERVHYLFDPDCRRFLANRSLFVSAMSHRSRVRLHSDASSHPYHVNKHERLPV